VSSAIASRVLAFTVAVLLLAIPATAMASGDSVLEDCADDGALSRTYSQAEYKAALANLPADLDEYSDCRAVIRRAQLSRATTNSRSGTSGTGGKSKISTRDKEKVKRQIQMNPVTEGPLRIGNAHIKAADLSSSSSIPTPLVVVLLLAALGAAAASAIYIRRIVLSRRNR
jgi:hypothetical protein